MGSNDFFCVGSEIALRVQLFDVEVIVTLETLVIDVNYCFIESWEEGKKILFWVITLSTKQSHTF